MAEGGAARLLRHCAAFQEVSGHFQGSGLCPIFLLSGFWYNPCPLFAPSVLGLLGSKGCNKGWEEILNWCSSHSSFNVRKQNCFCVQLFIELF